MSGIVEFKGIDPQEIYERPSAVRLGLLETMLQQHGFERIEGGRGSHFRYRFRDEELGIDEIVGLHSHIGDDLNYKNDAAAACIRVRQAFMEKNSVLLASLDQNFTDAAVGENGGQLDTLANLPDFLMGEAIADDESVIVIRSRHFPQIGQVFPSSVSAGFLKSIGRYFSDLEVELEGQLDALREMDSFIEQRADGSLVVTNSYAELYVVLPVFNVDEFIDPHTKLEAFGEEVASAMSLSRDIIMQNSKFVAKHEGESLQEQEMEWVFSLPDFFAGQLKIPFTTDGTGRLPVSGVHDLFDRVREELFGGARNRTLLRDVLAQRFGIILKKPKGSNDLIGHHPFIKGSDFAFPDINARPLLSSLHEKVMAAETEIDRLDYNHQLTDVVSEMRQAREVVRTAIDLIAGELNVALERYNDIHQVFPSGLAQTRKLEAGQKSEADFEVNGQRVRMRYMIIAGQSGSGPLFHPDDMDKLEQALAASAPNHGLHVLRQDLD